MGSFFQPLSFFNGGRRSRRNRIKKGGFYPSIMGGVVKSGSMLIPLALRQGSKLLEKKKTRKVRRKHK
jgi:hypothetical protein